MILDDNNTKMPSYMAPILIGLISLTLADF